MRRPAGKPLTRANPSPERVARANGFPEPGWFSLQRPLEDSGLAVAALAIDSFPDESVRFGDQCPGNAGANAPRDTRWLPGMRLHYREYGRGIPVILLHGMFGSLDNWHAVSCRLASNFRVFALDQRNHGRSPHSRDMDYVLMASDVVEFLDARSLASAHVVGHSMGGKAAMQFALSFPERSGRLVVEDIAPRAYAPRHGEIFDGLLALDPGGYHSRRQIETVLAAAIPELSVRKFLLKNLSRDPNGKLCWKLGLRNISENYAFLNSAISGSRHFEKPALFIRGSNSDYIRDEDAGTIHRSFPFAQIRTISDAGHWVHTDAPTSFTEMVEDFLLAGQSD